MIYVLALIGLITVAVLLWKAFGPQLNAPKGGGGSGRALGPDDDPDFLWRLSREKRHNGSDEPD